MGARDGGVLAAGQLVETHLATGELGAAGTSHGADLSLGSRVRRGEELSILTSQAVICSTILLLTDSQDSEKVQVSSQEAWRGYLQTVS